MLDALVREGRSAALLTYATGAGRETRFEHRVAHGGIQPKSLRSGPSFEKIAADVALASALRTHARTADVVIAHHVEAAALALALGLPRWIFVAHTTLGHELPTYLPTWAAPIARRSGRALDRLLARRAPGVAAISAHVSQEIATLTGRDAVVLPVPMDVVGVRPTREAARRVLGIALDRQVVLYAGNLDAYQGLEVLVDALVLLRRPRLELVIASQSDPTALRARLAERGIAPRVVPLATEQDRANAHAAADVAVVTRGTPGGFPIKLLDGLARGVPMVAMRRALSDEFVPGVRVADDDACSLAAALGAMLDAHPDDRRALSANGADHLATRHDAQSFVRALDVAVARLQKEKR
jgi:glycosyltransferase involved in cell wall biosynthesis